MGNENVLRTRDCNVRVGDKSWVDGVPAVLVKAGGKKKDRYTVKELLTDFYGEKWKYIIVQHSGGVIVIE